MMQMETQTISATELDWLESKSYTMEEKTPKLIQEFLDIIIYQQERIKKLEKDNKSLHLRVEDYKNRIKQKETTQDIMRRIWDNKEDEFWDEL